MGCEAIWMSLMLGFVLGVATILSTALWQAGYIGKPLPPRILSLGDYGVPEWLPGSTRMDTRTPTVALWAVDDYLWTFTQAIPIVQIPEALGWVQPDFFPRRSASRILAEVFKVFAAVPLVQFAIHIIKDENLGPPAEVIEGPR